MNLKTYFQLFSHREQLANKQRQTSGEEGANVDEASAGGAADSAATTNDATNNAKTSNGATPAHAKVCRAIYESFNVSLSVGCSWNV